MISFQRNSYDETCLILSKAMKWDRCKTETSILGIAETFPHRLLTVSADFFQLPLTVKPVLHTTASGFAPELTSLDVVEASDQQAEVPAFSASTTDSCFEAQKQLLLEKKCIKLQ